MQRQDEPCISFFLSSGFGTAHSVMNLTSACMDRRAWNTPLNQMQTQDTWNKYKDRTLTALLSEN